MSVLAAISVLVVLVIVHEMGHFLAARLQGIYANRFSIGFGPVIWKYQGPKTEYAVRGFPLGGFVGFPDDDPDSTIPADDPNLLRNRPIVDRMIVISAGVVANLIFAYMLLVSHVGIVGIPEASLPGVLIPQVSTGASRIAAEAGIQPGDIILKANDQVYGTAQESVNAFKSLIKNSPNQPVELTIQRGEQTFDLKVQPEQGPNGAGMIGVQLQPNGKFIFRRPRGVGEVLDVAATEFQRIVTMTLQGFGQLISNFQGTAGQVAGPVGIVKIGSDLARSNAPGLLQFGALISINLAILNSLPLPALDGGQLLFLIVEGVRGRPIPTRIQDGIMQTGLVLILGLGTFLILRDTAQLFQQ
jgi:membrane-associated protease RseP (regulator of RpoE activity)